ncbi:MAG: TIGR02452 family protein [Deltaproteobacteria bacterium]|nr:TIGR02452 family protein [Deltaproteobacteria bacterium]
MSHGAPALYSCQLTQRGYCDANRATDSMLYTDHLIWSPDVPFFRGERLELLDQPFFTSVVTSPAPNAGEALRRKVAAGPEIRATLERRAAQAPVVRGDGN